MENDAEKTGTYHQILAELNAHLEHLMGREPTLEERRRALELWMKIPYAGHIHDREQRGPK